jgi:uncharacterized protein (TIGR03437 family)
VTLTVTPNIANPLPGTYQGSFDIVSSDVPDQGAQASDRLPRASSTVTQTVNYTLTVSNGPTLLLSQTGMEFNSIGYQQSQNLYVSVNGSGSIPFTAQATTLSGGSWLSVTPGIGGASATSPAMLSVTTNPGTLAPGTYTGRIDIAAAVVSNSPQSVEVIMVIQSEGGTELAQPVAVSPSGLVFTSGGGNSGSPQSFTVTNSNSQATSVSTFVAYQQNSSWLTVTPAAASVPAGGATTFQVAAKPAGLGPGLYPATISLQVAGSHVYTVGVGLIVEQSGANALTARPHAATACTPTQLFAVSTATAGNFTAMAGLPVPLQALVVDDCGNPLDSGQVVAAFSSGDASVSMLPIGQGVWSGTWLPHNPAGGPATVTFYANTGSPALAGTAQISGTLLPNSSTPVLSATGPVVNGASYSATAPIVPGSFVSIFGSNLAASTAPQTTLPYPTTLGGTKVLLGGIPMPLEYAGNGQINAIVPWSVPVNTSMQLIVEQNGMASMPEPVVVSAAAPALFTSNASGTGQGAIIILKANGAYYLPGAGTASAGDVLEIYATGLGAVNAAIADGASAPSSPPAQTVAATTVTIGGQPAQVLFAGLAPGFAGLYQINAVVPAGVTAGANVPVIVTVGGTSSGPVTIAAQ